MKALSLMELQQGNGPFEAPNEQVSFNGQFLQIEPMFSPELNVVHL
jgi:hypothetical protein